MKRLWVLLYRDAYKPGVFPVSLDDRPAVCEWAEAGRPPPWVEMTEAEKDAAVAATDAAWAAFDATQPAPQAPAPPPVLLQSPNGTVFVMTVDDSGVLSTKVVTS